MSDQPPDNEDAGITEMEVWVYAYSGPYAAVGDGCCGSETVTRTSNHRDGRLFQPSRAGQQPAEHPTTTTPPHAGAAPSACWGYPTARRRTVRGVNGVPDAVSTCASTTCKAGRAVPRRPVLPRPVRRLARLAGWQPIAGDIAVALRRHRHRAAVWGHRRRLLRWQRTAWAHQG